MSPTPCTITVQRLTGGWLEVDLDLKQSVCVLKRHISDSWMVPPVCQKLIVGTHVLDDSQQLASFYNQSSASLAVTMVVSLDMVHQHLNSTDPFVRCCALTALSELSPALHADVLTLVMAYMQDPSAFVRQAATRAVQHVAKADDGIVDLLCARLVDYDGRVRTTAANVLGDVVDRGNEYAVAAVRAHLLVNNNVEVQLSLLEGLTHVAKKGRQGCDQRNRENDAEPLTYRS